MNPLQSPPLRDATGEIAALIETLRQTEQRLEELTAGEVDTVTDRDGRTLLLRRAQVHLRHSTAVMQAAILNALPAHIALLDAEGLIVSVNEAWRRYGGAHTIQSPGYAVGVNYLEVCGNARGEGAAEAHQAAAGVRSVLGGAAKSFSLEYASHSPTEQRWFLMTATPLAVDRPTGAVIMHQDITERRRAENELRVFASSMDALSDAIYVVDRSSMQFVHVNDVACRMRGQTRDELFALGPAGVLSTSRAELEQTYDNLIASGAAAAPLEIQRTRADGSQVWLELRRHALRTEDRWTIVTLVRDITERKKLDDDLRRFRMAMDISGDAILLIDRASMRYIDVNQTFCDLVGRTRQEMLGMTPMELFGESRETLERDYDALIADNFSGASTVEGHYRHTNGALIPIETRRRALHTDNGWVIVGSARDVTKRKQAEKSLLASELRFRQIAENIRDVFFLVDTASDRFLYVNPVYEELTGRSRESLYADANSWIEALHPDDRASAYENYKKGKSGEPYKYECRIVRPDGSIHWFEIRGFPVRDDAGKIVRITGVAKDITEHKQTESRIGQLNRVYAITTALNSAIVRIRERGELFREICRIAVSEGGFFLARVIEFDPKGIASIAATSESDARLFQRIVDEYNSNPEKSPSLLAIARRGEQPLISNDVAADPRIPNRAALTEAGNYALALLPFFLEKRVAGAILLRTHQPGAFDEAELRLLLEFVSNFAFALAHMEEEAKVRRLTRVYAVLSGINSLIVRVRDRDELFKEACRVAVEQGQFKMAWIGVTDWSALKIVRVAYAGGDPDFLAQVENQFSLREDAPMGNTLSALAAREKKAVVSNDIRDDSKILFVKQRVERGIASIAVLPLLLADKVVGVLALYADEIGFFDEQELKLLTEMAGDIAFAIDHIGKREQLDYLAYYDALTGLANRRLFLERMAQNLRTAAAGGHKLALFLVDLERFKNLNDSLGRPAGDALLKLVAEWLTHNTGDASLLARVGADHFAVVLPVVKSDGDVAHLLEKMIEAFLRHPFHLSDAVFRIAAKVGVAIFPDDAADADTLFTNAEAALKKAKAHGDRYLFYKQKMTEAVAGKLTLENQLRQALDKEEFVLHYQPKVSLASGTMTSAEALIRWNDPRTGLVPPGRFIPILEETGLIYDVGRWALRQAIKDYLRWRAAGLAAVRIAVNVSPLQLRSRGFIAEVEQVIGIGANAADGLELEITESLIMEDVKHNIASLTAIRALGVTIAIDDFGTGFSSLSYLAKLPVDTLKIDRSFVIDMTAGADGLALVSTIINLAHSIKLKVVAEGVETEEQSRLLRLLGCDEMQGFLFSKPVPAGIFETKFLAAPAGG